MFSRPLKTQMVSVGIVQVELLHPIWGDLGRLEGKPFTVQLVIDRIHIGSAEIDAQIAVSCDARGIRWHGALVIKLVCGIQHDFGTAEA